MDVHSIDPDSRENYFLTAIATVRAPHPHQSPQTHDEYFKDELIYALASDVAVGKINNEQLFALVEEQLEVASTKASRSRS